MYSSSVTVAVGAIHDAKVHQCKIYCVIVLFNAKATVQHRHCMTLIVCVWVGTVLEGQLWKGLCTKEFPEVTRFEDVIETDLTRDSQAAGSSGSSFRQNLEREERIFRHLFRELKTEPMIDRSCIREALTASSTDNYPEESIFQTLYPRPRYSDEQTPSYWSSTGQRNPNVSETLTYNLVSRLCVVHEVRIRPFQGM